MTAADFYLYKHRHPDRSHRDWIPATGRRKIDRIIIHTAESGNDWDGDDSGAERVAAYFASAPIPVSAHVAVDTDTRIDLLPPDDIAFHCRRFNTTGWGIELCLDAATAWKTISTEDLAALFARAGQACAEIATRYQVPIVRLEGDEAQASGARGFCGHADLDPTRRTDPGRDFPWPQFLEAVQTATPAPSRAPQPGKPNPALRKLSPPLAGKSVETWTEGDLTFTRTTKRGRHGTITTTTKTRPFTPGRNIGLHTRHPAVAVVKSHLLARGYLDPRTTHRRPHTFTARDRAALIRFQTDHGLVPSGEVDPPTGQALALSRPT